MLLLSSIPSIHAMLRCFGCGPRSPPDSRDIYLADAMSAIIPDLAKLADCTNKTTNLCCNSLLEEAIANLLGVKQETKNIVQIHSFHAGNTPHAKEGSSISFQCRVIYGPHQDDHVAFPVDEFFVMECTDPYRAELSREARSLDKLEKFPVRDTVGSCETLKRGDSMDFSAASIPLRQISVKEGEREDITGHSRLASESKITYSHGRSWSCVDLPGSFSGEL